MSAHLYIVQGESGMFKIGRTTRPAWRIGVIEKRFERYGDKAIRVRVFSAMDYLNAISAESWLINALRLSCSRQSDRGREWFAGMSFETVAAMVREARRYAMTDSERPESITYYLANIGMGKVA